MAFFFSRFFSPFFLLALIFFLFFFLFGKELAYSTWLLLFRESSNAVPAANRVVLTMALMEHWSFSCFGFEVTHPRQRIELFPCGCLFQRLSIAFLLLFVFFFFLN